MPKFKWELSVKFKTKSDAMYMGDYLEKKMDKSGIETDEIRIKKLK